MFILYSMLFFLVVIDLNVSANSICPTAAAKFESLLVEKQCQYGISVDKTGRKGAIDFLCHTGSNKKCDKATVADFIDACKTEAPTIVITSIPTTCRYLDINKVKACPITEAQQKIFEENGSVLDLADYRNQRVKFYIRSRSICANVFEKVKNEITISCAKYYKIRTENAGRSSICTATRGAVLFKVKYPASAIQPKQPSNQASNNPTNKPTDKPDSSSIFRTPFELCLILSIALSFSNFM